MEGALILVKHAMPAVVDSLVPHEWKLDESGQAQAVKFSQFLKNNFDLDKIIYSSDEPKALQTAEIIADTCKCKVQSTNELREIDREQASLMEKSENTKKVFEKVDEAICGKESAVQALERFEKGIKTILEIGMEEERVVVTHGAVMSLFLAKYNKEMSAFDYWEKLEWPSYAVVDAGSFKILEFNGRPLLN